jgi:hypothetical protein
MIAATMVNMWRDSKSRPAKIEQFMPRWGPKKPVDAKSMEMKFAAFAHAHNAQIDAIAKRRAIRDRTNAIDEGRQPHS